MTKKADESERMIGKVAVGQNITGNQLVLSDVLTVGDEIVITMPDGSKVTGKFAGRPQRSQADKFISSPSILSGSQTDQIGGIGGQALIELATAIDGFAPLLAGRLRQLAFFGEGPGAPLFDEVEATIKEYPGFSGNDSDALFQRNALALLEHARKEHGERSKFVLRPGDVLLTQQMPQKGVSDPLVVVEDFKASAIVADAANANEAIIVLSDHLIPPLTEATKAALVDAIKRAQKEPPEDVEAFVAQVNRLLDTYDVQIRTSRGEARLNAVMGKYPYIKFQLKEGGSVGGFKEASIELVARSPRVKQATPAPD